ncbi:hydroxymethylglutaryl-CoA lyase [Halalkalibacterium ligniniphilum]|uniref:hydroxymethylglutaryl-CoA lyase n=1 Tax=Halalkalibacterium ligniniphilum TaxID=1134413 RepID=UPI00034D3BDF
MEKEVRLREVGPRDGLQNEQAWINTEDKINLINALGETGLPYIEMTSFVHPKWIPALADASEVVKGIKRRPGVTYGALVPNEKGLERALEAGIDEVSVFISASETHNQKNINKTIDETFPVLKNVIDVAKKEGKTVRGYVSTVFGCPYEGEINQSLLVRTVEQLMEMGVDELSLGDTIGVATPNRVKDVLSLLDFVPIDQIALHFHDTKGMAVANVVAGLEKGVIAFDGSVGGLGGCPYAPGAAGNVATEDLLYLFQGLGLHTGVDMDALLDCAMFVQGKLHKTLPSHNLQAKMGAGGERL